MSKQEDSHLRCPSKYIDNRISLDVGPQAGHKPSSMLSDEVHSMDYQLKQASGQPTIRRESSGRRRSSAEAFAARPFHNRYGLRRGTGMIFLLQAERQIIMPRNVHRINAMIICGAVRSMSIQTEHRQDKPRHVCKRCERVSEHPDVNNPTCRSAATKE